MYTFANCHHEKTYVMKKTTIPIYLVWIFTLSFIFQSCFSVRLISEYDETMDKTITSLQEDVTRLLVNIETHLGSDKASYANHISTYENIKVKLRILEARASILDKNKVISGQVAELKNVMTNFEKLHRIGFTNMDQLKLLDNQMNTLFTSLIKFQIALKRGEKS